ncbi:MAG: ATP-binding protein, partial [bacterium]|nr:ATP-binding protein [bacterium]
MLIPVEDLLFHRRIEAQRVEFKSTWDERVTPPQVLNTICAFANDFHNVNGGYLILGVEERSGVAV